MQRTQQIYGFKMSWLWLARLHVNMRTSLIIHIFNESAMKQSRLVFERKVLIKWKLGDIKIC